MKENVISFERHGRYSSFRSKLEAASLLVDSDGSSKDVTVKHVLILRLRSFVKGSLWNKPRSVSLQILHHLGAVNLNSREREPLSSDRRSFDYLIFIIIALCRAFGLHSFEELELLDSVVERIAVYAEMISQGRHNKRV